MVYARKDLRVLVHNKGLRAEGHRRIIAIREADRGIQTVDYFPAAIGFETS
jgi:hypothetical protein